ncbi:MAG: hypothetical protein FWD78_16845 [Treponema sp.]|nr:hypothetical protein [Treponema sp.]
MRRAAYILFAASFIVFLAGCATSGKEMLRKEKDPIALVSVISNYDINWNGEDPTNPLTAGSSSKRALRAGPDMALISNTQGLVGEAEVLFRNAMANSDMIDLADKETVLNSRAYQEARLNSVQMRTDLLTIQKTKPEAYRFIDSGDKNFFTALAGETGIQRSMFLQFNFTKMMSSGLGKNGDYRAVVDMKVYILDSQGKTIFQKTYTDIRSIDTAKVSSGAYSESELMALFKSTIPDACQAFLDDLVK